MSSGLSKGIEGAPKTSVKWRTVLVCAVILTLGVVSANQYGDDLIRKFVGDRETINHARVLTEADLVSKLEELLGSLSLHQKLVALENHYLHPLDLDPNLAHHQNFVIPMNPYQS